MKIGILGGTFDPIHVGHLYLAERAMETLNLDEVWFIPTFQPPHKQSAPLATPEQRIEMVKRAIVYNDKFHLIDSEIRRGGTSYTFDTIERLRLGNPHAQFYFIIGTDILLGLDKWYKIDELLTMVTFVTLARPGYDLNRELLPEHFWEHVIVLPITEIDISSTEIREHSGTIGSIRTKVSAEVYEYIKENALYDT